MPQTTDLARIEPILQRFGKEKGTGLCISRILFQGGMKITYSILYQSVRGLHHG